MRIFWFCDDDDWQTVVGEILLHPGTSLFYNIKFIRIDFLSIFAPCLDDNDHGIKIDELIPRGLIIRLFYCC